MKGLSYLGGWKFHMFHKLKRALEWEQFVLGGCEKNRTNHLQIKKDRFFGYTLYNKLDVSFIVRQGLYYIINYATLHAHTDHKQDMPYYWN